MVNKEEKSHEKYSIWWTNRSRKRRREGNRKEEYKEKEEEMDKCER